jgi:mannose-6-phosphate isomerase-like protein (cupin superfamily)
MSKLVWLAIATLVALPLFAQDTPKTVFYSAQQMKADLDKAPANDIGESEINLTEHIPDRHAAILLRRTKPGMAEVHTSEADVWYVIDGGCVLEVGGTVVGGHEESPGQIRGTAISGGEEHTIAKGDFIRIPAGVPHRVKKINGGEIVYTVVKYTDAAAK